ncbi:unnamed protein product [Paramecium pentaurelia]|uniref:Uncharacterized protein n=1 Tax=Paramecium pentaurelia TaxID=43138 RepID=A0A8S1V938_9CILI|nr:unnamed protein product [Paramecium pentaurelia]
MNKVIDKIENKNLDPIIVMKNREYLIDHLVIEELVKKTKTLNIEEDLDSTIIICNSDYED